MRFLLYVLCSVALTPAVLTAQPAPMDSMSSVTVQLFDGYWEFSARPVETELLLTEHALSLQNEYDLLEDDPSLKCVPASLGRVWSTPSLLLQIISSEDRIDINYRMFDLRRTIPLAGSGLPHQVSTQNLDGDVFPEMGSSIAFPVGKSLVVYSDENAPGYVRTSVGIPQATTTVAVERFWLEDADTLKIELTYYDDALFEEPFSTTYTFERRDLDELGLYECMDADYDWFEQFHQ